MVNIVNNKILSYNKEGLPFGGWSLSLMGGDSYDYIYRAVSVLSSDNRSDYFM